MATAATRTGQFDLRHDLDYFRVTLVAGQRYVFTMNGSGANPVTVTQLQLFTPGSAVQSYAWDNYDFQPTSGGGSVISYVARESGTFYLLAQLPAGQTIAQSGAFDDTGSYTVSANSVALDDHSDIPASGTALTIGGALTGVFDLRLDLDHFKLTLTGGQRYLFTMNGSGAQAVASSSLNVLDANGESVVIDVHATSDGGAKIAFVAPTSGSYTLLATKPTSYFLTTPVDTGSYTVAASSVALDDHADLRALGTVLGVGATLAGAFDLRHDLDYFKATLNAGQRYLFKMNGGGAAPVSSSNIELFDPQGLSVVTDTQSTANGGAMFSFVAPSSGTYSLLSTLAEGAQGGNGDTGNYTVNLTSVALDDHSDLPATGTVLNVGGALAGQVDLRMDLDYFRVNLTAGQRVHFQMQATGATPINTADVRLRDPQGEFAGFDVSFALDFGFSIPGFPLSTPAHAKFVMTAATTGTYTLLAQQGSGYIALGGSTATVKDQGSYTVSATAVPLDDHSDIMTLGTPLAVGATLGGAFDFRHDFDYFKATLTAGQRYLLKMVGTTVGSPTDTTMFNLTVFESQGLSAQTDAATTYQGGAIIAYVAPVSGTYYVLAQLIGASSVFGGTAEDTASYRLSLEAIALDDHSDLRQQGTVLFTDTPPANVAPVAANGSGTTNEDTALTANLPAATDANGDPITYARTSSPAKGSVTVNANGSYTYTPSLNANGSDTFSFSVSDGKGGSNSYTQTITITPVNDPATGGASVSGTPQVGQTLTAASTLADADGMGALAYQWLRAGAAIAGATAASYLVATADVGAALSVRVSFTDGGGSAEAATSAATAVVPPAVVVNQVVGTAGNDNLLGSAGVDLITGLEGNDTLAGLAGNDTLEGGGGRDVLAGGTGSDTVNGGGGIDIADYRGASAVNANLQSGVATQGGDSDTLIAIEAIFGSSAADTLRGLDGGANLPGETVRGGGGNDSIDGGTGIDMAEFSGLLSAYTISRTPGTMNVSVAHNGGGADGTDALNNVELLLFGDRVVGFGPRVEEVARVAFALWSPAIYASHTLFSKGLSFYTNEFGYSFDTLCQVALQYHPEVGLALATKLVGNAPGTTLTAAGLLTLMNANGGGDSATGRAAAVKAVALDAATSNQLDVMGVMTKGVVATLNFDAEVYFGPLPG